LGLSAQVGRELSHEQNRIMHTKAVIFLARRQIRKYAKEQVGTSFLRWCILRTRALHRVFCCHAGCRCADSHLWAMPTSHLFEVALAVDGSKLSSKKVSKLSRRYIRLKKKISTMADDPATDAWMCPACSFAKNSLDCLRCTMCTAARPRGSHSVLLFSTKMKDTNFNVKNQGCK
jgi:hypothetical protein